MKKVVVRLYALFFVLVCTSVHTSCVNVENKQKNIRIQFSSTATEDQRRILTQLAQDMVLVEGGTFMMGASGRMLNEATELERPAHKVTVSDFYICKYEVTQELWEAVMGSNPSTWLGNRLPVEKVSWDDCNKFVMNLNHLTGLNFRLPTEAEWEFAARGGNYSQGYCYSGSDSLALVGWFIDNAEDSPQEVGMLRSNELGLYDMSGNVREWCADWYSDFTEEEVVDPKGPSSGSFHVYRGGCWGRYATYCRVTDRFPRSSHYTSARLGLRLAL